MNLDHLKTQHQATARVASVDALRGLIILLMIFVNDLAGAGESVPNWLRHANEWGVQDPETGLIDAMSLPDIVFPAFLFIAGVSIPLAFSRKRSSGARRISLLSKILLRTFALLVMGVIMVNQSTYTPWPYDLWNIAMFIAFLFTFSVLPREQSKLRVFLLGGRWVGAVALIGLLLIYRNAEGQMIVFGPLFDPEDKVWLRHQWWGILGLIGWAYLVASIVYLLTKGRREWLVGAIAILSLLYLAQTAGMWERFESRPWMQSLLPIIRPIASAIGWIGSHVGIGGPLGSLAAITTAGAALGTLFLPDSNITQPKERVQWAIGFCFFLCVLGLFFDPIKGIDKNQATPAWCLFCAAICCGIWIVLFMLMDWLRFKAWAWGLRPAGENPLMAYLLHPFVLWTVPLTGLNLRFYHSESLPLWAHIVGSLAMAFFIVALTGLIARVGVRLKV